MPRKKKVEPKNHIIQNPDAESGPWPAADPHADIKKWLGSRNLGQQEGSTYVLELFGVIELLRKLEEKVHLLESTLSYNNSRVGRP